MVFCSVALYNTIKEIVTNDVDIRLKWPNDLMIENYKVAGILLESIQNPFTTKWVIVGVGVNIISSPKLKTFGKTVYDRMSCKLYRL